VHSVNSADTAAYVTGELPITLTRPDRSIIQQQKKHPFQLLVLVVTWWSNSAVALPRGDGNCNISQQLPRCKWDGDEAEHWDEALESWRLSVEGKRVIGLRGVRGSRHITST
jgi:hypothetical protein